VILLAVGHLAKRCGVDRRGYLREDGLNRGEDRDLRLRDLQHMREVYRVPRYRHSPAWQSKSKRRAWELSRAMLKIREAVVAG
jgi:hypothetical protein